MPDFPDFTIPKWDKRDWTAKEATFKTWGFHTADPISPGGSFQSTFYTVPSVARLRVVYYRQRQL